MPRDRIIVGLMSGTSVDGIDAAVVRVRGKAPRLGAQVLHHAAFRWPDALRKRLLAAMAPAQTTTQELCALNAAVAERFAAAAAGAIAQAGLKAERIAALASHGQTVCHLPPTPSRGKAPASPPTGSTLQLGDPSVIATLTGITTVGNFRPADMALGGQGAPLVPWADHVLLAHRTRTRCVQNIGGIANVTYIPPTRAGADVLAFDTGPGNMLMDAIVARATGGRQRFDRNGRLAARGKLHLPLFRRLQEHAYFDRQPPKSTGREAFGDALAADLLKKRLPLEDLLATVTHLTAWSIADAYLNFLPMPPDEVILCGGGADNPTLVGLLRQQFDHLHTLAFAPRPIAVARIDDFGIPNKAKEAASFALLAAATLDGVPSNLPSVTGAARAAVLGVIARGATGTA